MVVLDEKLYLVGGFYSIKDIVVVFLLSFFKFRLILLSLF